jgi:hypothetical protein
VEEGEASVEHEVCVARGKECEAGVAGGTLGDWCGC